MKIKVVVFDWDGTLYDSAEIYAKHNSRILQKYGKPPVTLADLRNSLSAGSAAEFFQKAGIVNCEEARQEFNTLTRGEPRPILFPGARETLRWLQNLSIASYIASTHPQDDILKRLDELGIRELIADVQENNSIIAGKIAFIHQVLQVNTLDPSELMYVDDMDILLAKAKMIGCYLVGAANGFCSYERLVCVKPHHIIQNLSELPPFVASLEAQYNED